VFEVFKGERHGPQDVGDEPRVERVEVFDLVGQVQ
jgi:hypothetical protein